MKVVDYLMLDKYLESYPEDEDMLKSVVKVCQRQRTIGTLNGILSEAIETGLKADWDPIFTFELNGSLQSLFREHQRSRIERRTRPRWE